MIAPVRQSREAATEERSPQPAIGGIAGVRERARARGIAIQPFTGRRLVSEYFDDPEVGEDVIRQTTDVIRRMNKRWHAWQGVIDVIGEDRQHWPTDRALRFLDLGTGAADIPEFVADWVAAQGGRMEVTALDLRQDVIDLAKARLGDRPDFEFICGNALEVMEQFEPGAFDYVHAGMFLHHLPDIEVVTMLRIMDRLSSRTLLWNDLINGPVERAIIRVLTLFQSQVVRHDALASVSNGFRRIDAEQRVTPLSC